MSQFRVHRVRFFNYEPPAIHALACENKWKMLAVGRTDNSIEIWSCKNDVFLREKFIPGGEKSVESLTWIGNRLFSSGMNGSITEYDLDLLAPKTTHMAAGGAIWCMTASSLKDILATGSDDGSITLFGVVEEGVEYYKSLDRQDERVLCLAWHPTDKYIVSGSADSVRIWNVQTGHMTDRITLTRTVKSQENLAWSVVVTHDFTIIVGDSCGNVSFFNGLQGTLLACFKANKADIFSLCLSKDQNRLFSAGIEPVISQFQLLKKGSQHTWVKSMPRIFHTHDVKALCYAGDFLISGGVDSYLGLSKYPPKTYIKLPYLPQNAVHVAEMASIIMLQYTDYLELWRLGCTQCVEGENGTKLKLSREPVKLLQLKARSQDHVVCSHISSNGEWLIYSHTTAIHFYHLHLEEDKPLTIQRVRYLPAGISPAHHALFISNDKLAVAGINGAVQILHIDQAKSTILHSFPSPSKGISHLAASRSGQYLAVSYHYATIIVYDVITFSSVCSLPTYEFAVTSLCFHPERPILLVVYSDKNIVEYSLSENMYTDWSREYSKAISQSDLLYELGIITNVMYNLNNHDQIILHDDSRIQIIDQKEVITKEKRDTEKSMDRLICKRYKYLVHVGMLHPDWLIAVEQTPDALASNLPPPLEVKKFGV